jgi:hypothetical protein
MVDLLDVSRTQIDPYIIVPDAYQTHRSNYGLLTVAFADHTTRALLAAKSINIPGVSGKIYTLHGVEITIKLGISATGKQSGGLFELENDAVDWKPCEMYTNTSQVSSPGGISLTPTKISLHKPLPAGSNVSCYYTAFYSMTDMPIVTLIWSTEPYSGLQTFIKSGAGAALTQITSAAANITVAIPANKGGNLVGFYAQVQGVILVTTVTQGGMMVIKNPSCNPTIDPCELAVGGLNALVTGGGENLLTRMQFAGDCPGNSNFKADVQPTDATSQLFYLSVVWEA